MGGIIGVMRKVVGGEDEFIMIHDYDFNESQFLYDISTYSTTSKVIVH